MLFEQAFGELVALLRSQPAEHAAQDQVLTTCTALVSARGVELDAGVEVLGETDPGSLKARLLARRVDTIRIGAGAEAAELLFLAQALAHDAAPVTSSTNVVVALIPQVVPRQPTLTLLTPSPEFAPSRREERRLAADRRRLLPGSRYRGPERRQKDRRQRGERRVQLVRNQATDIGRFQDLLKTAIAAADWLKALHALAAVMDALPAVPYQDRRGHSLATRRLLSTCVIEQLILIAAKDTAQAPRAARVLRWIGPDAADAMLARLMDHENVGPWRVLYEILGGMPEAFAVTLPYLQRGRWHEARHAAEVLGRLGNPEAIDALRKRLADPDERVRTAVVQALSEFPIAEVAEALRAALSSPSARTRIAAADAIARRRATGFAMPLRNLLEQERDPDAWRAVARALGLLQTPDAATALVSVALARKSLLGGSGYATEQRLEAVRALSLSDAAPARAALQRLATDADGPVRAEASRLLRDRALAAG